MTRFERASSITTAQVEAEVGTRAKLLGCLSVRLKRFIEHPQQAWRQDIEQHDEHLVANLIRCRAERTCYVLAQLDKDRIGSKSFACGVGDHAAVLR